MGSLCVTLLNTSPSTSPTNKHRCPRIQTWSTCTHMQIVWGTPPTGRLPEPPPGSNCRIVSLEQVESLGRRHPRAHVPPKPSDTATLCYTSGTTGVPKGACGRLRLSCASQACRCVIGSRGRVDG